MTSKEKFYKDLHEVFTIAFSKTGDFYTGNYRLWINERYYYYLVEKEENNFIRIPSKKTKIDDFIFSGYIIDRKNIITTTTETNYFYLEYLKNNGENMKFIPPPCYDSERVDDDFRERKNGFLSKKD